MHSLDELEIDYNLYKIDTKRLNILEVLGIFVCIINLEKNRVFFTRWNLDCIFCEIHFHKWRSLILLLQKLKD
jgi:hypothetical protein